MPIGGTKDATFFEGLQHGPDGIWRAKASGGVSYPLNGNRECALIEDHSFWFTHRNDCIADMVHRNPPAGPIVDVGGGNGFVARRLIDEGFPSILVEPGEEGARYAAHERKIPSVICGRFEDLQPRTQRFDAVGLFDVLEHIDDDRAFLSSIAANLREGGLIYLTVPAYGWLWSPCDPASGHYRRYDRKRLARAFGAEFDILHFTYFFRFLVLPILLVRALPYRLGITRFALSAAAEHGTTQSKLSRGLGHCARRERERLRSRTLAWGASCMLTARKRRL